MKIEHNILGRAFFHTDCKKSHLGGVMKVMPGTRENEHGTKQGLLECLHCGGRGWYGVNRETCAIHVEAELAKGQGNG